MFEASPRWGGTNESDMLENLMPFWMENYFKRENYLVIDNKPVLFVYQQQRLSKCFQSAESQKETFDACREYAKQFGFDGMIFAACYHRPEREVHEDMMVRGYDLRFGYTSGYKSPCDFYDNEDGIIDGQCDKLRQNLAIDDRRFVPTASCFWDPTPRYSKRWCDLGYRFRDNSNIWYLSPEKFKELLKKMKAISDALPEDAWARKIMMIDNWNEWDEGHFVAPSHKFGYKYLQAIREVFTACNNLPDYRAPHDQGFCGYNTSWREPDFAAFCKEALHKK